MSWPEDLRAGGGRGARPEPGRDTQELAPGLGGGAYWAEKDVRREPTRGRGACRGPWGAAPNRVEPTRETPVWVSALLTVTYLPQLTIGNSRKKLHRAN